MAAMIASAAPNDFAMYVFIGCECLLPEETTTDLYPAVENTPGAKRLLLEWFKLDEGTFIRLARESAESAHRKALTHSTGSFLEAYMAKLEGQGLSKDQITTHLLKKYYKSLRSKTALHRLKQEYDEYEDEEDD
jgi:hypothetical protein